MRVVSGGAIADTAGAVLATPLVIQVSGRDGRPAVAAVVQASGGGVRGGVYDALDAAAYFVAGSSRDTLITVTTGSDGKASLSLALGSIAGSGHLVLRVAALDLQDSVAVVVQPATAVGLRAIPHDTAVVLGRQFTLRFGVVDAHGNIRSGDAVTASAGSSAIGFDATGTVRGAAYGRAFIAFAAGARKDTAWVSVVPNGTLAATQWIRGDSFAIVTHATDGSDYHVLAKLTANYVRGLSWTPDAKRLLFARATFFDAHHLYALDIGATPKRLMPDTSIFARDYDGVYSADGEWLYFTGEAYGGIPVNYRARPNGSGVAQVLPQLNGEILPSPSPDGTRLATLGGIGWDTKIVLKDLATASYSVVPTATSGIDIRYMAWSPRGDLIAFLVWNDLYVIRPDGTGLRKLGGTVWSSISSLKWSPDGRWLTGTTDGGLTYVDLDTGMLIPVSVRAADMTIAWRP